MARSISTKRKGKEIMKLVRCFFILLCLMLPSTGLASTVNVAVPSFSMSLVAFMAAKERGYYRQEGLDVNFVLMPAAIASRALIACNVDFATVGGSCSDGCSRRRAAAGPVQLVQSIAVLALLAAG